IAGNYTDKSFLSNASLVRPLESTLFIRYTTSLLCVSRIPFCCQNMMGAVPFGPNEGIVQVLKAVPFIGLPFLSNGGSKSTQAHNTKQTAYRNNNLYKFRNCSR